MARYKSQSHRVTETRRITQVKALVAKNASPERCGTQASMEGICLNAHRNGVGMGAAALAAVGVGFLAAKTASAETATDIMVMREEDAPKESNLLYSHEVSVALAVAAIASAASTVIFGVKAYKTRRNVPGIIGPSGLVPLNHRKDEGNPFRNDGVSDDEYVRIRKETHVWGKKNRKERYMIHMDVNTLDVSLNPTDFQFTFNKNTLPLVASIVATMAFASLYLYVNTPTDIAEPAKIEQRAGEKK